MSLSGKPLGQWAEDLAFKHLKKKGFRILERNWRTHIGEIDLIGEHHKDLVFVEVKAGVLHPAFDPSDHLTEAKKHKLRTLAQIYLSDRETPHACRFDLITVVQSEDKYVLDHFEDVIEDRT